MSKKIKKILNICIIIAIIIAIAFVALMLILRYGEKGETNMPFEISKVTVVSTVDAQNVEDNENKWNKIVSQNNDIYIDVKKNEEYSKDRIIKNISVSNIIIESKPSKGEIITYKPSTNAVKTFENKEEYRVTEINYEGGTSTDIQNLKISNQGGRCAFRLANNNVGSYISNEEDELDYSKLLEKMGLTDEELKARISFDFEIVLTNGKSFKTNLKIEIPIEGIIAEGKSSKELENLDLVYKRTEN